jgi:hypothetical protein
MNDAPLMDTHYFDAHPPLIGSPDDAIPDQSDYAIIGQLSITGQDMNRVVDPEYPWREFVGDPRPAYHRKALQILASRDADVDRYVATRRRYWRRVNRWHYGTDTAVSIVRHTGYVEHESHVTEQTTSVVDRVAADLGIDLSPGGADAPADPPPVPPMPMADADDGGSGTGGGSNSGSGLNASAHFSHEMTQVLHITDTDEQTFTEDTTVTVNETFLANTTYVYWQMCEECVLERVRKSDPDNPEPVYSSLAAKTDYTDAYPAPPADPTRGGGGGDIH